MIVRVVLVLGYPRGVGVLTSGEDGRAGVCSVRFLAALSIAVASTRLAVPVAAAILRCVSWNVRRLSCRRCILLHAIRHLLLIL